MRTSPCKLLGAGCSLALLAVASAAVEPAPIENPRGEPLLGPITDIGAFLDQCPTEDPALTQIVTDFEIRRNGELVPLPTCSAPIADLPLEQYTDELIVLQGLRVAYYMDRGQSGHLPWTPGTLYDWLRSKIDGINLQDGSGSSCCTVIDGKTFITVGAQNEFNRDFDRTWMGISGNIGLYAHEARHVDGFGHESCCGISGGCDASFDPESPSAYGVQWWLNRLWLEGTINVGFACLEAGPFRETVNWHLGALAGFRNRFCTDPPAQVSEPAQPGGPCFNSSACVPGPQTLCLQQQRFAVQVQWRTQQGTEGSGRAVPLTDDAGYFWFFNASNIELVVKMVDACAPPFERFWVFAAGLTNVETRITVTDTLHDVATEYQNPLGTAFQPVQDTQAFETCP